MRIVSDILPKKARDGLRRAYDSFHCKSLPDKETIGVLSQWTMATRDMRPGAAIYSGGVGEDISFEKELVRRFGVGIHLFDPSPIARRTIDRVGAEGLFFEPVGLAASAEANFSVGGGEDETVWLRAGGSNSVPCTTLPEELRKNGHTSIDLLKIDIEGFEYEVLESCFSAGIPIKQICVEFHDFFPNIPRRRTAEMIRTLKARGFELIHRHRHDHTFLLRAGRRH